MGTNAVQPLSKAERVKHFGEVFTPQWMVDQMCDLLQEQNPEQDVFAPETTFLEPTCGDGVFIMEILRRKFSRCKSRADYTAALRSVYGMELQADNVKATIERVTALCREHFSPTRKELDIINDHIIQADSLKIMKMMNDPRLKGGDGDG